MATSSDESHNPAVLKDERFSLVDLLIILAKHKWIILSCTVGLGIVGVALSLLLPNIYVGTARLLPPQQQNQSAIAAMMLSQLGGLGGAAGSALGIKNPSDLYVAMLKSRTVADSVIARFDLQAVYKTKTMVETRRALTGHSEITSGREGLITIEFEDKDAARAAAVANAYVQELEKLTQTLAVTEAGRRRIFFERQLQRTKNDLINAEIAARSALEKGGVAMVDEQGRSMLESIARLRAQITAKEVQMAAMKAFAAAQNPELLQAQQQLDALRDQLSRLEGSGGRSSGNLSSGQGLKNVALLRDVKYNEVLFELLARQYELARIDEAKDAAVVQVLDNAVVPDRRTYPKPTLICALAVFIGLFIGILAAIVREAREKARHDPTQSARLSKLRVYATAR